MTLANARRAAERGVRCDKCQSPLLNHAELQVIDDTDKIVGHIDLALYMNALLIVEVKSMARPQFEELNRPQPDHIVQTLLYWRLFERKRTISLYDKVSILYVCKDWKIGTPFKEFVVDVPSNYERATSYLIEARQLNDYRTGTSSAPPPRTLCSSRSQKRAQSCPAAVACFRLAPEVAG
jgi:hypothetical protein